MEVARSAKTLVSYHILNYDLPSKQSSTGQCVEDDLFSHKLAGM